MPTMTYYVALAFKKSEDGGDVVACDPREACSSDQAIPVWPAHWRKRKDIAEPSRSDAGDPALCDFEDAVNLKSRLNSGRAYPIC